MAALTLDDKANHLLQSELRDSEPHLARAATTNRIGGVVVWPGFEGQTVTERQDRLWGIFDRHLSADEEQELTLMITLTAEEYARINDDSEYY